MSFEFYKESYAGAIKAISIGSGDKAITVGGETCYPLYQFEGEMPHKPKIAMEIGTADGGTLFLLAQMLREDGVLISLDLFFGKFGGGYPPWKIPLYKSFAAAKQHIHLIRSDSHLTATKERVIKLLEGRKVDFLMIDGDHSYEGVKKDFELYSPLVRDRGIIAFHDIVCGPEENVGEVWRFWREIREQYAYREILKDRNQNGGGLGLLYMKMNASMQID